MATCCIVCKTPVHDIPPEDPWRHRCAFCENHAHPGCLIGPIYTIPEYLDLMRTTQKAVLPDHFACPACVFPGTGRNCCQIQDPGCGLTARDDQDLGNADNSGHLTTCGPNPRQAHQKRMPARYLDPDDPEMLAESKLPALSPGDSPMKRLYDANPLPESRDSPAFIHHFLAAGQSIKHRHLVPVPEPDGTGDYQLAPKSITVMKDGALATENGSHNTLFSDPGTRKDITGRMQHDFNAYRDRCISESVAPYLMTAMLSKWEHDYGEPVVAHSWGKVWDSQSLTRVEANSLNPNRGGFPTDNNAVESSNNSDKNALNRIRTPVHVFIPSCVSLAHTRSCRDKEFGVNMKSEVYGQDFIRVVEREIEACRLLQPCSLTVFWNVSGEPSEFPSNARIIAAANYLARQEMYASSTTSVRKAKEVCQRQKNLFEKVLMQPSCLHRLQPSFDVLVDLCRSFHVIAPVHERCYVRATWQMLKAKNFGIISFAELTNRPVGSGLWSCSCNKFRQYAWCLHVHALAINNGVILATPRSLCTGSLNNTKPPVGRPRKAKGGTCFEKY
jgi:hypothetical protein